MQAATAPTPAAPLRSYRDPNAPMKAQAAFDAVWSQLQAAIDATASNDTLSPDRRAAAIHALRERQRIEAAYARRRVIEEEAAAAKQRREAAREPHAPRHH